MRLSSSLASFTPAPPVLVVLACIILGGSIGPAQTPPAGKASQSGEPYLSGLPIPTQPRPATNPPDASTAAALNPPGAASTSLNGYVPDDKYILRVGDKISLQILEDRDLPKSLVVADSGELDVPYVGRTAAAGKTCKQLADELKAALEKEYYYRATVIIALDSANRLLGRVYVWGQVHNQGPIDIAVNENLTVGKAILRAGGFSDFANKKKVRVIRGKTPDPPAKKTFELNMVEILEDGKTENDVLLEPDDSIIVPSRLINF